MKRLFVTGLLFMFMAVVPVEAVFAISVPSDYTELEYIQSTGTQYIDTGIAKTSQIFDIKTSVSYANTTGRYLFGTSGSSPNYCGRNSNGKFELNNTYSTLVSRSNVVYDLHYYGNGNRTYFTISTSDANTETLSAGAGSTGERNYTILGNGAYNLMRGNIYYYELSVGNVLKFKGIPAKRNSDEAVGMYDMVSGNFFPSNTTTAFIAGPEIPTIKIATTAYNAARFNPVKTDLDSVVATIREIVTNTINQTAAIASLQADKQTRPEDACPAGKKCLLVETEENGVIVPHWFPIIEAPEE